MNKKGFSLVEIMIAAGFVAILVLGGYFLFSIIGEEGESYVEERIDAIEKAEDVKKILEERNIDI